MLHIPPKILEQLSNDALEKFPYECGGFLLGFETTKNRFVTNIFVINNNVKRGNKRKRFEITPVQYIKAEKYAAENGLSLLGVYHSHPRHVSIPNKHSKKALQPYLYVIISVHDQEIKSMQAWILNNSLPFEEEIIFQNKELTNFKIKTL